MRTRPRQTDHATLRMLWFFLVISVPVYLVVARFAAGGLNLDQNAPVRVIAGALGALSIVLLGAQVYFRSFLSDARLFPRITEEMSSALPGEAGEMSLLLQNHFTFGTILWAMGEAPAIFGLVLTLLSGDMRYAAGFAAYSLVNLFSFRPRRSDFEDQLARLRRHLARG